MLLPLPLLPASPSSERFLQLPRLPDPHVQGGAERQGHLVRVEGKVEQVGWEEEGGGEGAGGGIGIFHEARGWVFGIVKSWGKRWGWGKYRGDWGVILAFKISSNFGFVRA